MENLIADRGLRIADCLHAKCIEGGNRTARVGWARPSIRIHPSSFNLHPSAPRRGVTLLEVLVSMFVLAVGLMGLASLLPLANFYKTEASKYDRASTLGQEVYADMQLRGYLQPKSWLDTTYNYVINTTSYPLTYLNWNAASATPVPFLPPVVIDPLAIGYAAANAQAPPLLFPAFPVPGATLPGAPTIFRLTLDTNRSWLAEDQIPTGVRVAMAYTLAQRLFTANDDMIFGAQSLVKGGTPPPNGWPADADLRPASLNAPINGSQTPDYQLVYTQTSVGPPPIYTFAFTNTNNNVPVNLPSNLGAPTPAFQGDYSWLLTVSPDVDDVFQLDAANMDRFTVSVVIFYKRDFNLDQSLATLDVKKAPPERMVFADLLDASAQAATGAPFPTNFSGGAVRLRTPVAAQWLDLKPNEWLMISGFSYNPFPSVAPPGPSINYAPVPAVPPPGLPIPFCQWYRIAAVGETLPIAPGATSTGWYCDVQLAGPDWDNAFYAPPVSPFQYAAPDQPNAYTMQYQYATLCTGAIAVYEYQIILDESLLKD